MTPDDPSIGIPGLDAFSGLTVWGPLGFFCLFLIAACVLLFFAWQKSQNGRLQDNKDNQKDTLTALNNSTITISALKDSIANQGEVIADLRSEISELKGQRAARSPRG